MLTPLCAAVQLAQISLDKQRLASEKADLENALEAEQEYIMHKLHKQVRPMRAHSHADPGYFPSTRPCPGHCPRYPLFSARRVSLRQVQAPEVRPLARSASSACGLTFRSKLLMLRAGGGDAVPPVPQAPRRIARTLMQRLWTPGRVGRDGGCHVWLLYTCCRSWWQTACV